MRDTLSTNGEHLRVAEVKSFPAIPKLMRSVNGDQNGANLKKWSVLLVCTIQLCTENQCNQATLMAFYINFAIEFFHTVFTRRSVLRWLGTVVTSHTAWNRQAYTPVMSMLQKAVQSTHYTSCNQPAHTNVIMLYAVKCSLYVVGRFYAGHCIKVGENGVKMWQNCLVCQNEHGDICIFLADLFL